MKVVIPGGTGQVGTLLARRFHAEGHEVVVLSRSPATLPWRVTLWDAQTPGDWTRELEGADAVINLAGRSVNCRYTPENRRAIINSRVDSTRAVGQAIARAHTPPRAWLQASTATLYAHRYDAPNDEATGIIGGEEPNVPETWNFSIGVGKAWEQAFNEADTPDTRKVAMRSAIVMNPDQNSAFDVLLRLVRFGLGGQAGNGRQYVSWIHEEDFIATVRWLMERDDMAGAVNIAAPNPLPNKEFMRVLRQAWGIRFGLPALRPFLDIGAWALRTETELVLKSRRVVPGRMLAQGFAFQFPVWPDAAQNLCRQWRQNRRKVPIS